jgi:glycosyltransferase involved in cell wall biosynthesis
VRILHVSPYFKPAHRYGGPVESVYRLCLGLARIGCEVRALTTNADGIGKVLPVSTWRTHAITAGFDVRYCPRIMRHSVSPRLLRLLIPYVKWANVVHLTAVYSFPTIPTLLMCRMFGKPLVWSPRGALQPWRGSRRRAAKSVWERACKAWMPHHTLLHATSEEERDESVRRFPRLPAIVIPNGINIPRKIAHEAGSGRLRLGCIGRLDPKKGIENLLEACRILKDGGTALQLRIAGSGDAPYERLLRTKIETLGLGADVEMVGHLSGKAEQRFFEQIDIAVAPSYTENFGIVIAEALGHGVPVVASTGTPWARIEEIGCGLWVDNDAATLARSIEQMSRASLNEMGLRGRRWMTDEFSWERVARDMSEAYSSLAHGKSTFKRRPVEGISPAASQHASSSD